MPPLPQFRGGSSVAFGPAPTPNVRPGPLGDLLTDLGQGAGAVEDALQKKDDEDGRIWAAKTQTELRGKYNQRLIEAQNSGEDLNGLVPKIKADLNADLQNARKASPNKRGVYHLDLATPDFMTDVEGAAFGAEARYRVTKRVTDTEGIIEANRGQVFTNPALFAKAYTETKTLVDGLSVPVEAKARLQQQLQGLGSSAVQGMIESDPYGALKQLKSGAWNKYIDPDRLAALTNGAQSEINQREATARAEARAQRAEQRDIERDRLAAEQKLTATVSALNRVGAGALFDPRSADDRKAVDLAWEVKAETLTPEQAVPEMVRYSAQVGMVPERGKQLIRGLLRSSRDADVLNGAELIGRLRSQNAELMNDFAKEDTRLAESVLAQTEGGVPAQDALRRYREGQQIPDPVRDVRRTMFGDALKAEGKSGANALRTAVGGDGAWIGWVSDADVPPEAEEEFNRLRADEFIKTGSMDAATRFAGENIKRVYGVSELTGGRVVTKYAPEQWYGRKELSVADNAAWIRDQARADAAAVMGGTVPDGDVQLTPARRVGADGRPAYVITITKPDGERVVPMKNGKPVLFVPSFDQSPAKKKFEDEAKAESDTIIRGARIGKAAEDLNKEFPVNDALGDY